MCRLADYLPSGTVGQWPPATGQWWNERRGGDPKTDPVKQGADSLLPGWQPKENASQLPQQGGTVKSAWVASLHKVFEGPRTLASRRHWFLQVVAATSCALWTAGLGRSSFLSSSTVASFFLRESAAVSPALRGGCWSALSREQEAEGRLHRDGCVAGDRRAPVRINTGGEQFYLLRQSHSRPLCLRSFFEMGLPFHVKL